MRATWLSIVLILSVAPATAQFKWVDERGRIGYGDKPPVGAHDIEPLQGVARGSTPDPEASLPYELQRVVKESPVTLYSMRECSACDKGRSMLKERAVPFSEREIINAEDAAALKKLSGSDQLPVFQVGTRFFTGFNSSAWDEMLDLARYPHENLLPAGWVWPAPSPLTGQKPVQAAANQNAEVPGPANPQ